MLSKRWPEAANGLPSSSWVLTRTVFPGEQFDTPWQMRLPCQGDRQTTHSTIVNTQKIPYLKIRKVKISRFLSSKSCLLLSKGSDKANSLIRFLKSNYFVSGINPIRLFSGLPCIFHSSCIKANKQETGFSSKIFGAPMTTSGDITVTLEDARSW